MRGDRVLFSSVGLWEGFLGVKITRIPYHGDLAMYGRKQLIGRVVLAVWQILCHRMVKTKDTDGSAQAMLPQVCLAQGITGSSIQVSSNRCS